MLFRCGRVYQQLGAGHLHLAQYHQFLSAICNWFGLLPTGTRSNASSESCLEDRWFLGSTILVQVPIGGPNRSLVSRQRENTVMKLPFYQNCCFCRSVVSCCIACGLGGRNFKPTKVCLLSTTALFGGLAQIARSLTVLISTCERTATLDEALATDLSEILKLSHQKLKIDRWFSACEVLTSFRKNDFFLRICFGVVSTDGWLIGWGLRCLHWDFDGTDHALHQRRYRHFCSLRQRSSLICTVTRTTRALEKCIMFRRKSRSKRLQGTTLAL